MKTTIYPHLIQRGTIKEGEYTGLDSLINYDYMGAAEFEFGALPKALTNLLQLLPTLQINSLETPNHPNQKIYTITTQETTDQGCRNEQS